MLANPHEPRCAHCRDVTGVYEPMVALVAEQPLRTSRASDPGVAEAGVPCYHERCFASAGESDGKATQ